MGEPIDVTATDVTLRVTVGGESVALVVEISGRDPITIRGSWWDLLGLTGGATDRLSQLSLDYPALRTLPGHERDPLGAAGSPAPNPSGPGGHRPSAAQSSAATGPVGYRPPVG
jgi:hypothetical protein